MKIEIYLAVSVKKKKSLTGPAGWAACVRIDGGSRLVELVTGGGGGADRRQAEIEAARRGLAKTPEGDHEIVVFTTYRPLAQGASEYLEGWRERNFHGVKGEKIPDAWLWRKLSDVIGSRTIKWQWIRGQPGHPHFRTAEVEARGQRDMAFSEWTKNRKMKQFGKNRNIKEPPEYRPKAVLRETRPAQ